MLSFSKSTKVAQSPYRCLDFKQEVGGKSSLQSSMGSAKAEMNDRSDVK